jgi:5,10-methenyltetrahydrofolate synthetase
MKQDLRRVLLRQRHALTPMQRAHHDAALGQRLLHWCAQHPIDCLGVYWPIRGEPDLGKTYAELARHGLRLALPVVVGRDAPLAFAGWVPGDTLEEGALKVPVPKTPHRLISPDALLIPCVGFNTARVRLGYGGGFYDRTLARTPRPLAIGVAYQCTLAEFEADAHDIALDAVLTEDMAY